MTTKKKAFTLVELLAVIVILAILLVMAVPKILEVIKASKVSSMEDSAKLIAKTAEQKKLEKEALGDNTKIECSDVAEYNSSDYGTCDITFNNGVATITLKGKGKFDKLTCTGTKDNATCTESESSEPEWLYVFGGIRREVVSYEIDKENCPTIMQNHGMSAEDATTYCEGGEVNLGGEIVSIASDINDGNGSAMESAGVIKNAVYGDWNEGIEEDYRNLKDSNGKQRPVFIKFKSDLSEKYVCTMYDSTKADGFGTEPHCLLSANAYSTRNETGSQWNQVKTLFGDVDGSKNICSEDSSIVSCHVFLSPSLWDCNANSDGDVDCNWYDDDVGAGCNVPGGGNAYCSE